MRIEEMRNDNWECKYKCSISLKIRQIELSIDRKSFF